MNMQKVIHYRRRAEELVRLGNFGIDPDSMAWAQQVGTSLPSDGSAGVCANAAALLFVHAGIAMTDAMLLYMHEGRSTAQNHDEAAARLQRACGRHQKSADGVKHFQWLVQRKDFFAYDDKRVSIDDAKAAKTKIERFLTWAFKAFPEIGTNDQT